MSFSLPDRALLVKLFYKNTNLTVVVLQNFRILQWISVGPLRVKKSSNNDNQILKNGFD